MTTPRKFAYFFCAVASAVGRAEGSVTITVLEPLPDAEYAETLAINNTGLVVGRSVNWGSPSTFYVATIWINGTPAMIPPISGWSTAYGVSDVGHVVGECEAEGCSVPFVWHNGDLQILEGCGRARAVNDSGIVAGYSGNGYAPAAAVMWNNGRLIHLGTLGGTWEEPIAMNSNGKIAGNTWTAPTERAFVWEDGVMKFLETLGGDENLALGMNEHGTIVGGSWNEAGIIEAYIYDAGTVTGAGTFGYPSSYFIAINNDNRIVGLVGDIKYAPVYPMLYEAGRMILLMDLIGAEQWVGILASIRYQ